MICFLLRIYFRNQVQVDVVYETRSNWRQTYTAMLRLLAILCIGFVHFRLAFIYPKNFHIAVLFTFGSRLFILKISIRISFVITFDVT